MAENNILLVGRVGNKKFTCDRWSATFSPIPINSETASRVDMDLIFKRFNTKNNFVKEHYFNFNDFVN